MDQNACEPRYARGGLATDQLPDPHAFFGRQVKLILLGHAEGFVPGIEVSHDAVDAILFGAVRVSAQALTIVLLALRRTPNLCPGKEEALIAG